MAIKDKSTLDALILSLFPTGTGNISAADVRLYLDDILDSNVLQASTSVTDSSATIGLVIADIDENVPRVATNATGTTYTLPDVSTVKEGVTLVIHTTSHVPGFF